MLCKKCGNLIKFGEESIKCEGFCSDHYHAKCVGLSVHEINSCNQNTQLWWLCEACSKMMIALRHRKTLLEERKQIDNVKTQEVIPNSPSEPIVDHEIAELKRQVSAIHDTLAKINASRTDETAIDSISQLHSPKPLAHSSPGSSFKLLHGSRVSRTQPGRAANTNKKLWLFFTRISNTVSEDDISTMVADSLGVSECVVKKLVPRWKDASTLPYISFKVGLDHKYEDRALRSSTWPNGICFRKFNDVYEVWEPQQ